ncbi:MAG: plasmid pRiA4b ORF-3 family protein, partial [Bifidobacteriaceae bacterium]|nr:plasmid pRiA4b ORF-3 family protein [Bifidobacteriaceae bacterium]
MIADVSRAPIVRLRVQLLADSLQIWRLFEVDSSATLADLHRTLQCVMGWTDSHLHAFSNVEPYASRSSPPGRRWEDPSGNLWDYETESQPEDERDITVGELLGEGQGPIYYEYDFGDGWLHRIDWVADGPGVPASNWPGRVIEGVGRCPLEDSGGIGGWGRVIQAVADPTDEDHEVYMRWAADAVGPDGSIDVETFDQARAEADLERLGLARLYDRFSNSGEPPANLLTELMRKLTWGQQIALARELSLPDQLLVAAVDDAVDYLSQIPPEAAEALTGPHRWLLAQVGEKGMKLTQTGRLPVKVVRAAMEFLGIEPPLPGLRMIEQEIGPAHWLRVSAQDLGLVRKLHGSLHLTRQGAKAVDDPAALLRMMVAKLLARSIPEFDRQLLALVALGLAGLTERDATDFWKLITGWLNALGWCLAGGEPLSRDVVGDRAEFVWALLRLMGAV